MLLTKQARGFYFALQDLLWGVGRIDGWTATRAPGGERAAFRALLEREKLADALTAFDKAKDDEPDVWMYEAASVGENWNNDVRQLVERWEHFSPVERYVVLQQVGSTLRTAMVNDIDSRLR